MPDNNAALAGVAVQFERLTPDSPDECPVEVPQLLAYLAREVPEGDSLTTADLAFDRTARVTGAEYWVWQFREPGTQGDDAFATVSRSGGRVTLGYETNYYRLSAEQFILGDFHQVF